MKPVRGAVVDLTGLEIRTVLKAAEILPLIDPDFALGFFTPTERAAFRRAQGVLRAAAKELK
jgi:hypothetical protein